MMLYYAKFYNNVLRKKQQSRTLTTKIKNKAIKRPKFPTTLLKEIIKKNVVQGSKNVKNA